MEENIGERAEKFVSVAERNRLQRSGSQVLLLVSLAVFVCCAVAAVHRPALSAQGKFFDDEDYITKNPLVQNPGWASAKRFLGEVLEPSTVAGYYQPLAMISLMVDYALGGRDDDLRQFHRTSLFLHAANSGLVVVLLYLMFSQPLVAAGVGLLFGLHPMTVESVCWVSDRKTLLAAFFSLWSLIFYVRYAGRGGWKAYAGCVVAYILALMSKPTSVPLPVLMLLLDYWPLRRSRLWAILEKVPLFAVGFAFAIIAYLSQERTANVTAPYEQSVGRVVLILCHNIIFYLYKIVWPMKLSSFYAFPRPLGLSNSMVLAGVIGSCAMIGLLLISLRWTRGPLTGWLFFFVAISPVMGVVGFTNVIASDKYGYLPAVGLLMVLSLLLGRFYGAGGNGGLMVRRIMVVTGVLILAVFESIGTGRQLAHWRDTAGLYEHNLKMTPNAAMLHYGLGNTLESEGRLDEAIGHYRRAVQLEPKYDEAHNNLGNALESEGKIDEAISHYLQAIWANPRSIQAYNNLGVSMARQGQYEQALKYFKQALQINPRYFKAQNNLGMAYSVTGQTEEAIGCWYKAMELKPERVDVMNNIARVRAVGEDEGLGAPEEAVRLALLACKLTGYNQPDYLDTLAMAYAAAGNFPEAVKTARKAIGLARQLRKDGLAEELQKRLELYKAGIDYHRQRR